MRSIQDVRIKSLIFLTAVKILLSKIFKITRNLLVGLSKILQDYHFTIFDIWCGRNRFRKFLALTNNVLAKSNHIMLKFISVFNF